MNTSKTFKRIIGIFLVAAMLFCIPALATGSEEDFIQQENLVNATQIEKPPVPAEAPVQTEETQSSEPNSKEEDANPSFDEELDETEVDERVNEEASAIFSLENTADAVEDAIEEDEDTSGVPEEVVVFRLEEASLLESSSVAFAITLKWGISSENGNLYNGDIINLVAEFLPKEVEWLECQWQVAVKDAKDLAENEYEWKDFPRANDLEHTFAVDTNMQSWRWRLWVNLPNDETVYSEEIKLPKILENEVEITNENEDAEGAQSGILPFPIPTITLVANVPLEEIELGTEVSLVAEIENPREKMLLQWQYMPVEILSLVGNEPPAALSEEAWQDIESATADIYTYVIDEKNVLWVWRLRITLPEEDEGVEQAEVLEIVDDSNLILEDERINAVTSDEDVEVPEGTEGFMLESKDGKQKDERFEAEPVILSEAVFEEQPVISLDHSAIDEE